ncbi:MAG: hypothetical protein EPN50_06395 [Chloroflexota bacterium]|nr:MAG: hypothetical protein EPN50_06395 [Chloroflexota bacterium]
MPVTELSDPQIVWDPSAQRFYYSVLDVNRYGFAFGYSKTATPSSSADFCKYILDFGYGRSFSLPDYPKLAVTNDFVLIGSNIFVLASLYNGSDVDWLSKPTDPNCPASIGPGGVFSALKNADGSLTSTPVPAVNADPSSVGWVVGDQDVSTTDGTDLSLFKVTRDPSTGYAVMGPATSIPVTAYSVPADVPQPGTSAVLDTLDGRLEHAVAAYDPRLGQTAVWTAHTVFGGAGAEDRWYEIGTAGTPSLAQSGSVSSSSLFTWNGAIAPDRADDGAGTTLGGSNMVMGFNTGSSSAFSAIQMVSKRGAGGQSSWVLVKQSNGPNVDFSCTAGTSGNVCRWGDYSGAMPDPLPAAGGRVWLSGEWNLPETDGSATVWQTWDWEATP